MNQKQPKIMGILNVTPDSYYEGGRYLEPDKAVDYALNLVNLGADLIDIGGCSTSLFKRPSSQLPSVEEEINRVVPVIKKLIQKISIPISIDTYRVEVAQRALDVGAHFLNDVSGFRDPLMRKLAKEYRVPICIMHMRETPLTMQTNPTYPLGVVTEIYAYLKKQCQLCLEEGIDKNQIYIDPGIGFGKSLDDNFEILQNLEQFRGLNFPILLGLSRKSFLYKSLKVSPQDCLAATIAMNSAVYPNVDIFRVHDVLEHRQMIEVLKRITFKPKDMANYAGDSAHIHSDH